LQSAEARAYDQPPVPEPPLHPRFAESRLLEALADTPVVLIHGARQSGKTTLAQKVGEARGYAYFSLDDGVVLVVDHTWKYVNRSGGPTGASRTTGSSPYASTTS
jgi:hypothetical protein